jgi:hypothetical protein
VWLVPTAIALYVRKSYFNGFLKEAGKDPVDDNLLIAEPEA